MFQQRAAVSRRQFLSEAGRLGALYSMAGTLPFPALALGKMIDDPRIASTPVVDAGFASVRKIGEEKYKSMPIFSWGFCIASAITKMYAEGSAK
jgi:hypothetical protein